MADSIGFTAKVVGVDEDTYALILPKNSSVATIYIPVGSFAQIPENNNDVQFIHGKPEGSLTIITSVNSDREHENVKGKFKDQTDIKFAELTFQDLLDGEGKYFTGGTRQGIEIGLGVFNSNA